MQFDYEYFDLTDEHIKLLRRAYIGWDDCEYGAPAIDCKRPYGNSDVEGDIAEILGIKYARDENGEFAPELSERLAALHRQTKQALQVILSTGSFAPGRYRSRLYRNEWELFSQAGGKEGEA